MSLPVAVKWASDALARVIGAVVIALASFMVLCIVLQVVARYVFNDPLSWTEEVALLAFAWIILLMMALCVRQDFHVRMDLFTERLPPRLRTALEYLVDAATAVFGAYLACSGGDYVRETLGSTSAAVGYPVYLLYGAAPASGALVCWFALEKLLRRAAGGGGAP